MYKKFIFIIATILFIIVNFYGYNKNEELLKVQKVLNLQQEGLEKLSIFNDINILLKEYRGLSQFSIDNDKTSLQSKFERIVILINSVDNKDFKKKFFSLIQSTPQSKKEIFYEYTKAINYIESMIVKTAVENKLFALSNKDTYKYMSSMVYSIPKMIEIVGKIRGMGVAAITNKKSSEIEKFIMDDNLNAFYLYVNNLPLSTSEYDEMNYIYQDLKINVSEIKNRNFNINAGLYYDKHTEFIETIYGYYHSLHNMFDLKLLENQTKIHEDNKSNISYYFFYMITLLVTTVLSYDKLRRYEEKKNLDELEYSRLNLLYEKFTYATNLKDMCDLTIGFVVEQLHATSGQLYIVDKKNKQLSLASTYNISARHLKHILDMDEGIFSEVLNSKEIKVLGSSHRLKIDFGSFKAHINKIVTIPIISDDGVIVAIAQLNFMEDINIYKNFENIFKIIANNIVKSQKNEENEKYFNLIDKYVITSTTNKDGIINYASQAFSEISGYTRAELLGNSHNILKHSNVTNEVYQDLWAHLNEGKTWTSELLNTNKNGSSYWVKATISPEFGFYGDIVGFTSIREDITDKKTIEEISIRDSLTSLYNRRHFDAQFTKSLSLTKRIDKKLVFAMIDIDNFKQFNDVYGHQEGDYTLKSVSKILMKSFKRDVDMVFRLGGEEFGILFFTNTKKDALFIGEKLIKDVEELKINHKKNLISQYVTISMGLFIYEDHKLNADEVYKCTDMLLYEAKKTGRNKMITNIKDI